MEQTLSVIERCPSCSGALEIRELHCPQCDLQLRGHFQPPTSQAQPLAWLTPDQQAFLRLFVTSSGNLSDVERTLGVSYPTVRAKLDDLIAAFSEPPSAAPGRRATTAQRATAQATDQPAPRTRREVLNAVAEGRLSAADAAALLRRLPDTAAPRQ
jgi:hypothetical protein